MVIDCGTEFQGLLGILRLDMKFQQNLFGQLLEASGCVNFFECHVCPTPCHTFLYLLGEFATHGSPLLSDSAPWDKRHQNKRTVQFGGGLGIAQVYCECVVAEVGVSMTGLAISGCSLVWVIVLWSDLFI